MKKLSLFLLVTICVLINYSLCYSHEIQTHVNITARAVQHLSLIDPSHFPISFIQNKEPILQIGTIGEDTAPNNRYVLHFFPRLESFVAEGSCSSKEWAFGNNECNVWIPLIINKKIRNDFNWKASTDNYGIDEGWKALGFVIHLLEDLASPAHTRNDPHPIYDPFEKKNKGRTPKFPIKDLIYFNSPEDYFNSLQQYTRNNFFSDDTCFEFEGESSQIFRDDENYFYNKNNEKIAYKGAAYEKAAKIYGELSNIALRKTAINTVIAREQFDRLGQMAVLYVASFIKYYSDYECKDTSTISCATKPEIIGQIGTGKLIAAVGEKLIITPDDLKIEGLNSSCPNDFMIMALDGDGYKTHRSSLYRTTSITARKQYNPDYGGWWWQNRYKEVYDDIKVKVVVNDGQCKIPHTYTYPDGRTITYYLPDEDRNSDPFELTVRVNNKPMITGSGKTIAPGETTTIRIEDVEVEDADDRKPDSIPSVFSLKILDGEWYYWKGCSAWSTATHDCDKAIRMNPDWIISNGYTNLKQNYTVMGDEIIPDYGFCGLLKVPVVVNDGTEDSKIHLFRIGVGVYNYHISGSSWSCY